MSPWPTTREFIVSDACWGRIYKYMGRTPGSPSTPGLQSVEEVLSLRSVPLRPAAWGGLVRGRGLDFRTRNSGIPELEHHW